MIPSLLDLCLFAVRDGIENGTISDPHTLPLGLRQKITNLLLLHDRPVPEPPIKKADWIATIASPEYLRGFKSIQINCVNSESKNRYLDSMIESLEISGGVGISEIVFNLYSERCKSGNEERVWELSRFDQLNEKSIYEKLARLLSFCTELRSLKISISLGRERVKDFKYFGPERDWICFMSGLIMKLEDIDPNLSILRNLEEFSLIGPYTVWPLTLQKQPINKFKNLTSLTLIECTVEKRSWDGLLSDIRETVTEMNVHLINAKMDQMGDELNWIFPFPFPRLKSLKIDDKNAYFYCDRLFLDNLLGCRNLESISLTANELWKDKRIIGGLANINRFHVRSDIKIDIKIIMRFYEFRDFGDTHDENAYLDPDSNFKLTRYFNEHVTAFEFLLTDFECLYPWTPRMTRALESVFKLCPNLVKFGFDAILDRYYETEPELMRAVSVIDWGFRDAVQALKLRELTLRGSIDSNTLSTIFENCLNLDSLNMKRCYEFRDSHLIDFVNRGGRLSKLCFYECVISDQGLIPVVQSSGSKMTDFVLDKMRRAVTAEIWHALIKFCPNIKRIYGIPDEFETLIREKFLRGLRKVDAGHYIH